MYPSGSFDISSSATNGGWGNQWPDVSHQEASHPAQTPDPAFSQSEDTFVAYDPSAPPEHIDPPSYSLLEPPPPMSPADHPQYARILCSFARVSSDIMDRIQTGKVGDDDFAVVGHALCGRAAPSVSPSGQQACISLAKLVYRHVQGTFVQWYGIWRPVTSRLNWANLCRHIPELQEQARVRDTPPQMPWKTDAIDALGNCPRFWGYVDSSEGLAWTEDCVIPDEGTELADGVGGEQLGVASRDVQPPADGSSSSNTNHAFSQTGSGSTFPSFHGAVDQTQQSFAAQHDVPANTLAAQSALSSQQLLAHLQDSQVQYANTLHQNPMGHGSHFSAAPVLHRHQSLPSNPATLLTPQLPSQFQAAAHLTNDFSLRPNPTRRIIALAGRSRSLFKAGLISKETYGDTVLVAFKHMAALNGIHDISSLVLVSPPSSSSSATSALQGVHLTSQPGDGYGGQGEVPRGVGDGGFNEIGGQVSHQFVEGASRRL